MLGSLVGYARLVALVLLLYPALSAASFERLFTTAEQRQQIDEQAAEFKRHSVAGEAASMQNSAIKLLYFEAMIRSEVGYTIWINGQQVSKPTQLFGIKIDPQQMSGTSLILKTARGIRKLGLGQVYWVEQDKVLEGYEKP